MRALVLSTIALQAIAATTPLLPVRFEENRGQLPVAVRYVSRGIEPAVTLHRDRQEIGPFTVRFLGSAASKVKGESPLQAKTNVFGPAGARDIANFERIRYQQIYPGIDLLFYANGRELEYDFIVSPNARPEQIAMRIDGGQPIRLNRNGDLIAGPIRWKKPVIYQESQGKRTPITGRYRIQGNEVSFALGKYRRDLPLIIDPVVAYSTYLGRSDSEVARGVAVDGAGNTYVAGYTKSANLPVSTSSFQAGYGGRTASPFSGDGFIAKFSSTGSLLYLTYLGGSGDDIITALAVDSAGNAYVTGFTNSGNFPTTTGAFQTNFRGSGGNDHFRFGDAFVTKLNPAGSQLVYSTLVGGFRDEIATAIAIDAAGSAYITGTTLSSDFPGVANGAQKTYAGSGGQASTAYGYVYVVAGDAFVAKLNPTGTQLVYSTFFGGKNDDLATSIAVDPDGNAIIGGYTVSTDLPVSPSAFQKTFAGKEPENPYFNFGDGFVAKVNSAGTAFVYATYLGGRGDDVVSSLTVDAAGNAYLAGTTSSANFPVTDGVVQRSYQGPTIAPQAERIIGDMFVSKLNPAGSALVFSTYFGRSGDESATAIALDPSGNIFVGGQSKSPLLPTTQDALQRSFSGYGGIWQNGDDFGDGFLLELNPTATSVLYASYFGGGADDSIQSIALDRSGNLFAVGTTVSVNFPASAGAYQTEYAGAGSSGKLRPDAFLVKFSGFAAANQPVLSAITNAASGAAGAVSPGMVFVGYGTNLGPASLATAAYDGGKLSTANSDVRILFDGQPSPIGYVLDRQVSGIVPYSLAGKTSTQIVVEYKGVRSAPIAAQVLESVPGLFSANQTGSGQGSIYNQDNTVNSRSNPAARGSIVVLYGTGEGQTTPAGVDGQVAATVFPKPIVNPVVTIGGQGASIAYAGAVPGVVAGVFQINVVVPQAVGSGDQPVVVSFGNSRSQANLTVAIQVQ